MYSLALFPATQDEEEEVTSPQRSKPKVKSPMESKPKPLSPPPVMASGVRDEDDDGSRIMAELQVPGAGGDAPRKHAYAFTQCPVALGSHATTLARPPPVIQRGCLGWDMSSASAR